MPQAATGNVISNNEQVGADVIKTGNIKDLEIVNADISATANIAKSKVPDAATKGANTDITSLGGLTTALSVAQGGSGAATLPDGRLLVGADTGAIESVAAGSSGEFLKSNGAGNNPSWVAPPTSNWKAGMATRDLTAATSDVVIAHGLGRTPVYIRVTAVTNLAHELVSLGNYDGAYHTISVDLSSFAMTESTTKVISIMNSGGVLSEATVTLDGTNITFSWVRTGGSGSVKYMWEVC